MATATLKQSKAKKGISVLQHYDIAADAKNRISLRGAKAKYYHVKAYANGCYMLEPRELAPPATLSARTVKMLEKSVARRVAKSSKAPSVYDLGREIFGCIKGLPRDIATNPKYMEGFGE